MDAKDKAKELVERFRLIISNMDGGGILFSATDKDGNDITDDCKIDAYNGSLQDSKQCALIAVNEAILYHPMSTQPDEREKGFHEYWQSVKEEITKL